MKLKTKYRLMLYKKYFDTGYALTNYIKYFIAFFGLASRDVMTTLLIGFGYLIFCFFLGHFYLIRKWYETEQLVNNDYNPLFVKLNKNLKRKV